MEQDSREDKKLAPSKKKLEDAFLKGNFIVSKEVYNFVIIVSLSIIFLFIIPSTFKKLFLELKKIIANVYDITYCYGSLGTLTQKLFLSCLTFLSPLWILLISLLFFANFVHHGKFSINFTKIKFDLSKFFALQGIKKLFSKEILIDMLRSILKIGVMFSIMCLILKRAIQTLYNHPQEYTLARSIEFGSIVMTNLLMNIVIFAFLIAMLDYFYVRYRYFNSLKMSIVEQKEEAKQTEGRPEIKSKIKSERMKIYSQMLKSVRNATVVIVNPSHFAIALEYVAHGENNKLAPIMVAKAHDFLALSIKQLATNYKIPIVQNKKLAQALYKAGVLHEQIPQEHFEAVAKVLSYVFSLQKRRENSV